MWDYILGATIFGLIVTIGAWLNGKATRKYIGRLIVEEGNKTRQILQEHGKILEKLSEQHLTMIEILKSFKS